MAVSRASCLADQPLPIVTRQLDPKLGNRQRHDPLEADRARGQVHLPEPPIADRKIGADVHVWRS